MTNKCPKCGSFNIKDLGRLEKGLLETILTFGSNQKAQHTYQCKRCGHTWVE